VTRVVSVFAPAAAVAPAPAATIDPERELIIRGLPIVNDALARGNGDWSFGRLMTNMAPEGVDPADFTEDWFRLWLDTADANPHDFYNLDRENQGQIDEQANTERVESLERFLNNWPRRGDGKLDLTQSPFRLLSIVNRLDINEGRLSFAGIVVDTDVYPERRFGDVLDLAIIFEYELPPVGADDSVQDAAWWAGQWHSLAQYRLGSDAYRQALRTLTNRYAGRGVLPEGINGSALKRLRTNEQTTDPGLGVDVGPVWQIIGFQLSSSTGSLEPELLADTPHFDFNRFTSEETEGDMHQEALVDYLLAHRAEILDGTWKLDPEEIQAATYGPMFPLNFSWLQEVAVPAGLSADEWETLRVTFNNRTCNGCHALGRGYPLWMVVQPHEFMHISERNFQERSSLSPFVEQQLEDVRIPNMLSYIAPTSPRAKRADPSRMAVH
jgi:hypothetical protein